MRRRGANRPCVLATVAGATVGAVFEAIPTTLTVAANPNGSVAAEVGGAPAVTVGAGLSQEFAFSVESSANLTAIPRAAGWRFIEWTTSLGALACESRAQINPCVLSLDSVTTDTTVSAIFDLIATRLRVGSGPRGKVEVNALLRTAEFNGNIMKTVEPGGTLEEPGLSYGVLSAATLTATADAGYKLDRWVTTSGQELPCASEAQVNPCVLPPGLVTYLRVSATFTVTPTTLTVVADGLGEVALEINEVVMDSVLANSSQGLAFSVESSATLTATPNSGHRFAGWTLSGGLACARGTAPNICELPTGVIADARVEAVFIILSTLTVESQAGGSVVAKVGGGDEMTIGPGPSQDFTVSVLSAATLTATATPAGTSPAGRCRRTRRPAPSGRSPRPARCRSARSARTR